MKLGWIGLGNMGVPMVVNLTKRGFHVDAYQRVSKTTPVSGANLSTNLQAVVADKHVVVLMVPDAAAVEDVLFVSDAVSLMSPNTLVVNMSTIGVDETIAISTRVHDAGHSYMDAPVLGSVKPAMDGTLTVVAGGQNADFETMRPVFDAVSKATFLIGDVGQGAAMKLLVNAFLGMAVEALAETVSFGEQNQLSRELIFDVLETSAIWSPMLVGKRNLIIGDEYPAQFALRHLAKDLGLAIRQGEQVGVDMPATMATLDAFHKAVEAGFGEQDMAAMVQYRSQGSGSSGQA